MTPPLDVWTLCTLRWSVRREMDSHPDAALMSI